LTITLTNLNADLPRNLFTSKMMKFRQFLQKRRGKTVTSKGVEQSIPPGVEPDNQVRANDKRVLIGIDGGNLPPVTIPPRVGETG
jgi:hypothetical protein